MASSYPSSVKSFTTKTAGQTIAASHIDDLQDEVVAIEDALKNGFAHALKPAVAGGQDIGTAAVPFGTLHARALNFDPATTLTIATGAVTATRSSHALDTEAAAASDDLDTITATGLTDGFVLVLRAANVSHVVTLKDGTGNLLLNGDCALSSTDRTITLYFDGTNWREMGRSVPPNTSPWTLLHASSGTDTNASATNVDTVAISGLTAKDTLIAYVTIGSTTATTGAPRLYNSTDSVDILVSTANVAAAASYTFEANIRQRQTSAKKVIASGPLDNGGTGGAAFTSSKNTTSTFSTDWTGSWTLALRHNGVTATGTCDWSWSVFKVAGQ